jgi:hypothetical protein
MCHKGPLVEWFATQNSIYLKVAIIPFLQNRGDVFTFFPQYVGILLQY